jgi:hypothetical protein
VRRPGDVAFTQLAHAVTGQVPSDTVARRVLALVGSSGARRLQAMTRRSRDPANYGCSGREGLTVTARAGHGSDAHARSRRRPWRALVVLAAVSSSFALPSSAWATPKPAGHTDSTSAQAKIIADWDAFFSGSTPPTRKVALVQDGNSFVKVIDSQSGSPLAKSVAAKVSKVTLDSSSKAAVRYSLTLGGKPALSNVPGEAVLESGTWKVGAQSFCGLLALEQTKVAACSSK